jgi:hypothetical protein
MWCGGLRGVGIDELPCISGDIGAVHAISPGAERCSLAAERITPTLKR